MKQFLIVLILICTTGLYARITVAQINPVAGTPFSVSGFSQVFANVESDGSLVFYDTIVDSASISIRKVVCSPQGVISAIQPVITYNSPSTFEIEPMFLKSIQKDYFTYIYLKNLEQIFIFKLPDVALNTIPTVHVFENHGINTEVWTEEAEQLGNTVYYVSSTDNNLYALNLINDNQSIALAFTSPDNMKMALLGDEYLLIYVSYNNDFYRVIDIDGNITSPINNIQNAFYIINNTQPNIGGGIYPAWWSDGLVRTSIFGFVEYNNNQIRLVGLSTDFELGPPPTIQYDSIPLGDQRFICIETYDTAPYYQTYHFANDQFNTDTNFPFLVPMDYPNVQRLFQVSARYIVGVSLPADNIRKFACIDLQDQTIQASFDTLFTTIPDYQYYVCSGGNYIYYIIDHDIKIYAIERVTESSDPLVIPVISSANSYPNPFRGSTEIVLKGNSRNAVTSIYNLKGQLVRKLGAPDKLDADMHFVWDGKDVSGKKVPSGLYLYQVVVDNHRKINGKMVKVD